MSIDLTYDMKKAFFDRQKVQNALDRNTRRAMSRSLAFVRRRARSSLRRRKKTSEPGGTPSVHSKDPVATLKNVLFAYDDRTKSGIVGPVKLNQKQKDWINPGTLTVPQIMEAGGVVTIEEVSLNGVRWTRRDKRRRKREDLKYRSRRAIYRPRPFMRPALEKEAEAGNIASPWSNVVTG